MSEQPDALENVLNIMAAVRLEREAIARMLDAEARRHEDESDALKEYDDNPEHWDEAGMHDADAATLRSWADRIRARNNPSPPVAEPEPTVDWDEVEEGTF